MGLFLLLLGCFGYFFVTSLTCELGLCPKPSNRIIREVEQTLADAYEETFIITPYQGGNDSSIFKAYPESDPSKTFQVLYAKTKRMIEIRGAKYSDSYYHYEYLDSITKSLYQSHFLTYDYPHHAVSVDVIQNTQPTGSVHYNSVQDYLIAESLPYVTLFIQVLDADRFSILNEVETLQSLYLETDSFASFSIWYLDLSDEEFSAFKQSDLAAYYPTYYDDWVSRGVVLGHYRDYDLRSGYRHYDAAFVPTTSDILMAFKEE